ncbi:MAG: phosphatidylcholine/phosphatidylserine synthase [Rickettsiales bacterium]|jgi:CDP-diacylglycerol--serine O-phosphatidyltransferase|nr:phosphatidylcholine/phosphatidylserine synthase [Rickettsiales bacterium]
MTYAEKPFIIKCVPTFISLLAIWLGITAINMAGNGDFGIAAAEMLIAAFLDGIDGRVARALGVASEFGVQIDSLADAINFGVSPAFIVYFWRMNEFGNDKFAWCVALFLISCMVIRLARFNVDTTTKDQDDPLVKYFFRGMPAPAVASMVILPLVISFQFGEGWWSEPIVVILNTLFYALFAASTIPTPCFKKLHLNGVYNGIYKTVFYGLFALLFVGFIPQVPFTPWFALILTGVVYLVTIAISIFAYIRIKRNKAS